MTPAEHLRAWSTSVRIAAALAHATDELHELRLEVQRRVDRGEPEEWLEDRLADAIADIDNISETADALADLLYDPDEADAALAAADADAALAAADRPV